MLKLHTSGVFWKTTYIMAKIKKLTVAELNQIIDMIAQNAGEDGADFVEALRQMDRSSLIDVLSKVLIIE